MKNRSWGMLLLAIYLLISGIAGLGVLNLGNIGIVMPILAIASGALLLAGR